MNVVPYSIAACLIAAIRLRGEPIKPSPKLKSTDLRLSSACGVGVAGLARRPQHATKLAERRRRSGWLVPLSSAQMFSLFYDS